MQTYTTTENSDVWVIVITTLTRISNYMDVPVGNINHIRVLIARLCNL